MQAPRAAYFIATLVLTSSTHLLAADPRAVALLHQSLDAQGGEEKLRALKSVQWTASGFRNELEQSERPEGPYVVEFDSVSEIHDHAAQRFRNVTEAQVYPVFKFSQTRVMSGGVAMSVVGDHKSAGTPQQATNMHEQLALSPERLLVTALDAPDVACEPDTTLQTVQQNVVVFTLDNAPVRIYLNVFTHLPTAVDYSGPLARSGYIGFLGDVTARTYYSFWWLAKGGIHLPMQWNVELNELPDRTLVIRSLQIDAPIDDAALDIPVEVRAAFQKNAALPSDLESRPLGDPSQPAKELAPGIVMIPGSWNVTLIKQDDGIVILEAPISSGYSARVIDEAKRRFPGEPIKAVITTSDSWPHLAGIRQYVAENIPLYALDINVPILQRVISAPHASKPDALRRRPQQPEFHRVAAKTVLGSGTNRMEIYPLRGETSERQMMVYFPEHHLLYGSDPFQQNDDGTFFYPQTVTELTDAVSREHLQVDRFFMMHIGLTPWSDLKKKTDRAILQDSPTGVL